MSRKFCYVVANNMIDRISVRMVYIYRVGICCAARSRYQVMQGGEEARVRLGSPALVHWAHQVRQALRGRHQQPLQELYR